MTREEAIYELEDAKDGYVEYLSIDAINMAIEALTAKPCEDIISRKAAIDAVRASYDEILDFKSTGRTISDSVEDILSSLPPAQPEPKIGEWILGFNNKYMEKYYYCSRCGKRKYEEHKPLDYFCSNCGAKMRREFVYI